MIPPVPLPTLIWLKDSGKMGSRCSGEHGAQGELQGRVEKSWPVTRRKWRVQYSESWSVLFLPELHETLCGGAPGAVPMMVTDSTASLRAGWSWGTCETACHIIQSLWYSSSVDSVRLCDTLCPGGELTIGRLLFGNWRMFKWRALWWNPM